MAGLAGFSAVLMMANPVKGEAVLNLSGVQDLLPAVFAIWGLLLAVWPFVRLHRTARAVAFVLLFAAGRPTKHAAPLIVSPLAIFVKKEERGATLPSICTADAAAVLLELRLCYLRARPGPVIPVPGDISNRGITPRQLQLAASPILLALASVLVQPVVVAVAWSSWRMAVLECVVAALLLRVSMPGIDLVHLAGGGKMLLPIASVAIAFCALCHQDHLQHPEWPRHVVFSTSVLCVIFFALQIRSINAWRHAGEATKAFRPAQHRPLNPGKSRRWLQSLRTHRQLGNRIFPRSPDEFC